MSPWMVSPGVDLTVFVAVTLTTVLPWLASDRWGVPASWVLAFVALANGPHLISTWTRVYLIRDERSRRPLHYWVVPGALGAFAVSCFLSGGVGPVLVRTAIFYWASWHFMAQSWGVLRLYQRRHRDAGSALARIEKGLIFLPALFCVARRVYTGPWILFGVEILHPRFPAWVVNGLGALSLALAIVYAIGWLRRPRAIPWVRPLYLAASAFGFVMPYLVIKSGTSAFAAAALWHAIQYIGIVWLYNRRRYEGRPEESLIAWVSQPGRAVPYIALIGLSALSVYAVAGGVALVSGVRFQTFALAIWTALTLGHYYLDGVIWKSRRYPQVVASICVAADTHVHQ